MRLTKEQYTEEREALMNKAEELLDAGKVEEAETKMNEVDELDNRWEKAKVAIANMEALKDKTPSKDDLIGSQTDGMKTIDQGDQRMENLKAKGAELKKKNVITVGSSKIVTPERSSNTINPAFNEVSSLVDRVNVVEMIGGESFQDPYIVGYGEGGYTEQGTDYTDADTEFDYADINKAKVTAYAEHPEEVERLPEANYAEMIIDGVEKASRKKLTREILVGDGATNHLVGIFSSSAEAIDPDTDIELATIDNETLDDIVFSYGGDEDVEDAAVLILNKLDLKAFSKLRTSDGKKFHDIQTDGNTGTIDGIPFIINSACKAISDDSVADGEYCMAYGSLSQYKLVLFSETEIKRSDDYKFKQGVIAHKGSGFFGGNVVSKNGFLRIKKATEA